MGIKKFDCLCHANIGQRHSDECKQHNIKIGVLTKEGRFKEDMLETVANQEHYTQFEIQPMEYCQRNKLGWCASNVVKYVSRENKKDGLKDLYKAMDYLRCLIHWRETGIFLTPDKLEAKK